MAQLKVTTGGSGQLYGGAVAPTKPTYNPQPAPVSLGNFAVAPSPQVTAHGSSFATGVASGSTAPQPTPAEIAAAQVAEQERQKAAAEAAERARVIAEEQAYWDDQLKYADQSLGRLGKQKEVGYGNLEGSYQSGLASLNNSKAAAEQKYKTTRKDTTDDNILAKAGVDDGVRGQYTGLMRLLGARGAGMSRSATAQAGFAAATQGNQRRQQVQRTFGRNLRDLDNGWNATQTEFTNSLSALDTDKRNKKSDLDARFAQTEAEILQSKSDSAFKKAQAGGQTYTQARSARTPYNSRIELLMGQIDAAGAQASVTPKAVSFNAPSLQEYGYDRFIGPQASQRPAAAPGMGAYWNIGQREEEKKR